MLNIELVSIFGSFPMFAFPRKPHHDYVWWEKLPIKVQNSYHIN